MKQLNEETALSIIFANTKRKPKKRRYDLVTIAKSCEYLVNLYGSQKAVAKKIGLDPEMIRQFITVLDLPDEVQSLFSSRQLDSVDIAKELQTMHDSDKQIAAAHAVKDMLSKDIRDMRRVFESKEISIKKAKEIVLNAKQKGLNIFILDFDDATYRAIKQSAKKLKAKPAELVKNIVVEWLKRRKMRLDV